MRLTELERNHTQPRGTNKQQPTTVSVILVDKPLPDGTLDTAVKADLVWREAKEKLAAHQAHLIVGCTAASDGHGPALEAAGLVTVVAATVAALTSTIGIYWSTGDTVTETSRFLKFAESFLAGNPPVTVWVQLLLLPSFPTPEGDPTLARVTKGLQPFVGREIEFQASTLPPTTIAQRVVGSTLYLLSNGPVLKHGDSIGVSPEERIRVSYADHGRQPGVPERIIDAAAVGCGADRSRNSG